MRHVSWSKRIKRAAGPLFLALISLSAHCNAAGEMVGRVKELEKEIDEQSSVGTPETLNGPHPGSGAPHWTQREDLRAFQDNPALALQRQPLHAGCDLWSGRWVYDPTYPLWAEGSCSLGTDRMSCIAHGRNDSDFSRFRWQPDACTLPRFNAARAREALRGKRVVFLGDSLGRNQWQSLICMLASGLPDVKASVEEYTEPSTDPLLASSWTALTRITYFRQFNFTVEIRFSTNLVKRIRLSNETRKDGSAKTIYALDTGLMDVVTRGLVNNSLCLGLPTDNNTVLLLNTGHWWNNELVYWAPKGDMASKRIPMPEAFVATMRTVAAWLRTLRRETGANILWRGAVPGHFTHGTWKTGGACPAKLPLPGMASPPPAGAGGSWSIATQVMKDEGIDVLDVLALSDKRRDGHPEYFRDGSKKALVADCSHLCLPGVPDTWNELLLAWLTMHKLM